MRRKALIGVVLILSILPVVAHYLNDPPLRAVHDLYQRFCYLPIILAGLWFGVRGGVATAALISVLYFPIVHLEFYDPNPVFLRVIEIAMYIGIGWITGWLSDRLFSIGKEEKLARAETEKAYANLKIRTDELLAMGEKLRRAERVAALEHLSAGLAHEIRNPLASIKASVEILRSREMPGPLSEDEPDFIAIILEETARLDHTLTEFMQFSSAEKHRPTDEEPVCSVDEALRTVLELTEPERRKHNIRVMADADSLNVEVAICESLLHQVFLNLMINSVDAMPGGGTFRIHRLADEGNLVVLLVEDTGPGIAPENTTRVFAPFFTTKESGTGLGLSIVERVLLANDGSIALAMTGSIPTSRFILKIPMEVD